MNGDFDNFTHLSCEWNTDRSHHKCDIQLNLLLMHHGYRLMLNFLNTDGMWHDVLEKPMYKDNWKKSKKMILFNPFRIRNVLVVKISNELMPTPLLHPEPLFMFKQFWQLESFVQFFRTSSFNSSKHPRNVRLSIILI